MRIVTLCVALGLLAACGGGGGDSASAPSNNIGNTGSGSNSGVSMALSASAVSETATLDQSAPVATLLAYANGLTTGQEVYLAATYTNKGIASLSAGTGSSPITVSIQFQSPATLGAGTYQDTIRRPCRLRIP